MKKKILALCLVACLAAVALIGGTLAYFTDTKTAENTFTVGNVSIGLTEPSWNVGDEESDNVYPGEPLAKDPTVENTGKNPCFVRISVTGLDQFGADEDHLIKYRTNYVPGALGEGWKLHEGYFYYTKVLEVGDSTTALFDSIVMPTGLVGNEEAKPVVVTAEAVQAQGAKPKYEDVQKMPVEDIAAWFTACGVI